MVVSYDSTTSIGDSSVLAVDPDYGVPLRIWKRHGRTENADVCSYEDTLAGFPFIVKEGQSRLLASEDHVQISNLAKIHGGGLKGGYISSAGSTHRLGMTNTLGNFALQNNLLQRTTVYSFHIDELLKLSKSGKIAFLVCSDGLKDLQKAGTLSKFFHDARLGIESAAGQNTALSLKDAIDSLPLRREKDSYDNHIMALFEEFHDRIFQGSTDDLDLVALTLCCTSVLRGSSDDTTALIVQISSLLPKSFHPSSRVLQRVGSEWAWQDATSTKIECPTLDFKAIAKSTPPAKKGIDFFLNRFAANIRERRQKDIISPNPSTSAQVDADADAGIGTAGPSEGEILVCPEAEKDL
ncbi:hypothetical protein HDU97_010124 [Phlyctochytrium planicorne]|nr:hypothetical protein HDU97_010124 [Phlyctochytrium planicorne]